MQTNHKTPYYFSCWVICRCHSSSLPSHRPHDYCERKWNIVVCPMTYCLHLMPTWYFFATNTIEAVHFCVFMILHCGNLSCVCVLTFMHLWHSDACFKMAQHYLKYPHMRALWVCHKIVIGCIIIVWFLYMYTSIKVIINLLFSVFFHVYVCFSSKSALHVYIVVEAE